MLSCHSELFGIVTLMLIKILDRYIPMIWKENSLAAVNLCRRLAEVPLMDGSGGEKSKKRQRMAE